MWLFLKRQAWIWGQGVGVGAGEQGHRTGQSSDGTPHTHLMYCTCCQFRAAALRLGHVRQWQRHGLQASVLLQGLRHIQ